MNETEAAAAIASGALRSPTRFGNSALVAIRISGTGAALRPSIGEKVWRDPKIWLSDETIARCNGLPVILNHPETSALDTEEYADRSIGGIILPYIADRAGIQNTEGPDVWGIGRLFLDDNQLEQIAGQSTSPAVVFGKADDNQVITLPDGTDCLVEASPTLIDHVAIVMSGDGAGVWDKSGPNSGIRFDNKGTNMTEEEKMADRARRDAEDKTRKDAEGETIDKVLSHLDAMTKCMDAMSKRMDAMEARKDSAETEEEKKTREAKERADAAEIDHGKLHRDASESRVRHDAAVSQQRKIEETELLGIQGRADPVSQAFGLRAPEAYIGEKPLGYRKRLFRGFQAHSQVFKDVDVDLIAADAVTFDRIEAQVYADALAASRTPTFADDQVHYRTRTTESGHRITEGFGKHTVFKQLSQPTMRVTAFLTPSRAS